MTKVLIYFFCEINEFDKSKAEKRGFTFPNFFKGISEYQYTQGRTFFGVKEGEESLEFWIKDMMFKPDIFYDNPNVF